MSREDDLLDLMASLADHLARELGNPSRPAGWPSPVEVQALVSEARQAIEVERAGLERIRIQTTAMEAMLEERQRERERRNAPVLRNAESVSASELREGDTILIESAYGNYRSARVTRVGIDDYFSCEAGQPMLGVLRSDRSMPEAYLPGQKVLRKIKRR
ncbi:hypothetical protein ACIRBX_08415 [Kitasatospora sp. NPDC096147]|uniref:hypothetical protein n=1 Tax=Kitasatospora sp. NPDC096147 TaxID=3364093 RepID=UPI0037FB74D0